MTPPISGTIVPFVSVVLVVVLLAAGNYLRRISAVVLVGVLSVVWACYCVVVNFNDQNSLGVAVYIGFIALYIYVTHSLAKSIREYQAGRIT